MYNYLTQCVKHLVLHRWVLFQLTGGCQTGKHLIIILVESKTFALRTSGGESCALDTENSSHDNLYDLSTNQRIGIYGGMVSSTVTLVFFRTIFTFLICLAAARHLHNRMVRAILRAPLLFFDTNPVGMPYNMLPGQQNGPTKS